MFRIGALIYGNGDGGDCGIDEDVMRRGGLSSSGLESENNCALSFPLILLLRYFVFFLFNTNKISRQLPFLLEFRGVVDFYEDGTRIDSVDSGCCFFVVCFLCAYIALVETVKTFVNATFLGKVTCICVAPLVML